MALKISSPTIRTPRPLPAASLSEKPGGEKLADLPEKLSPPPHKSIDGADIASLTAAKAPGSQSPLNLRLSAAADDIRARSIVAAIENSPGDIDRVMSAIDEAIATLGGGTEVELAAHYKSILAASGGSSETSIALQSLSALAGSAADNKRSMADEVSAFALVSEAIGPPNAGSLSKHLALSSQLNDLSSSTGVDISTLAAVAGEAFGALDAKHLSTLLPAIEKAHQHNVISPAELPAVMSTLAEKVGGKSTAKLMLPAIIEQAVATSRSVADHVAALDTGVLNLAPGVIPHFATAFMRANTRAPIGLGAALKDFNDFLTDTKSAASSFETRNGGVFPPMFTDDVLADLYSVMQISPAGLGADAAHELGQLIGVAYPDPKNAKADVVRDAVLDGVLIAVEFALKDDKTSADGLSAVNECMTDIRSAGLGYSDLRESIGTYILGY